MIDESSAIAFSPNNDVLAAVTDGFKKNTLWNWRTGQVVATLEPLKEWSTNTRKPVFSSDGRMLIGGFNGQGDDSFLQTWNIETSKLGKRFNQVGRVLSLAISPDNTLLASAGEIMMPDKGFIHLWNLRTGELVRTINMPSVVMSVGFTPDGKQLISGGEDKKVTVWQVDDLTSDSC